MKAIRFDAYGPADVLHLVEIEKPKPLPTEVLVRVHAAGTNPVESAIRSGAFPLAAPPHVPGWDVSGVVEDLVPGVNRFQRGDEVFGMPFFPRPANAYAEYVVAPSRQLARKPRGMSHAEAAALPLAGLTAWQALVDVADVQAGQRVLVHAAGGGVGHLAVQIAKARGAYVVATASASKRDFVHSLGADEIIDYQAVDFAEALRDLDVVFELVGKDYGVRSIPTLKPGGLLVTATQRMDAALAKRTEEAGRRFAGITVEPDHVGLEGLAALYESGKLKIHVSHVVPLAEAARAHTLFTTGVTGKVVLSVA